MSEAQKNFIKKKKVEKIFITIIQLFISIIFLFVWEYLSSHKIINSFIFSSPSKIVKTIYNLYIDNNIFNHLITTIKDIIVSFSLGFILSMILALIFYNFNIVYRILDPYITMLN